MLYSKLLNRQLRRASAFAMALTGAPLHFCTAPGPPLAPLQVEGMTPVSIEGRFRFDPPVSHYPGAAGELFIEKSRNPQLTFFRIAVAGQNRAGSIRVRLYEGKATQIGQTLSLRTEHCYIFGRRTWTERSVPLERWDCDHLHFAFRLPEPKMGLPLKGLRTEETVHTEWIEPFDLTALPIQPRAHFGGQVIGTLEDGRLAIYGFNASKLLRNGQRLSLVDRNGTAAGGATVSERIGDIVLLTPDRTVTAPTRGPLIAWTLKPPAYKGLFD